MTDSVHNMHSARISWRVASGWDGMFTAQVLDGIAAGNLIARQDVVRELPGRRVSCVHTPDPGLPCVYLKTSTIPARKLYRSLAVPPGLQEWRAARALIKRGVPACRPIALGLEKRGILFRRSLYITEALPGSMTLKEFVLRRAAEAGGAAERSPRELVAAFAGFVAAVCRAGVLHRDLHWGNILIRHEGDGRPSFFLVDLQAVRLKSRLDAADIIRNLSLLNASIFDVLPARDRLLFLDCFRRAMPPGHDRIRLRDDIVRETDRVLRHEWRKRARRCMQENSYFRRIAAGGLQGMACRVPAGACLAAVLQDPDGLFHAPHTRVLKDSRSTASLILETESDPGVHLKRYNVRDARAQVKNCLRGTRARRAWKTANSMAARGMPVPRPLLFLERRRYGIPAESYLVTENAAGTCPLDVFVREVALQLSRAEKRACAARLAGAVRRMHDRGAVHGDLKAKNILVRHRGGMVQDIYFIDFDAARIMERVPLALRSRDLARLNYSLPAGGPVSRPLRLSFIRAYFGTCRRSLLRQSVRFVERYTSIKKRKAESR